MKNANDIGGIVLKIERDDDFFTITCNDRGVDQEIVIKATAQSQAICKGDMIVGVDDQLHCSPLVGGSFVEGFLLEVVGEAEILKKTFNEALENAERVFDGEELRYGSEVIEYIRALLSAEEIHLK
jgi:hypothetical protein